MTIIITGKHLEIGESLKTHIETELTSIVSRYMGEILEAQVVVGKENHLFRTDISVHISKNFVVHCHGQDTDPYKSAINALEKLESRISRYKKRLNDRRRHRDHHDHAPMQAQQYVLHGENEDVGEDVPLIIAEMSSEIPTLTVSEAVMKMDLADVAILMFRNAGNGQFNVVHRRTDGHVGWIDPTHPV